MALKLEEKVRREKRRNWNCNNSYFKNTKWEKESLDAKRKSFDITNIAYNIYDSCMKPNTIYDIEFFHILWTIQSEQLLQAQ